MESNNKIDREYSAYKAQIESSCGEKLHKHSKIKY